MPRYVVMKSTRATATSKFGYSGPTCEFAGIPRGEVYNNLIDALDAALKLSRQNPVGFIPVLYEE